MNNQEYEQKRRECWEEYLNTETPQLAAWNKGHAKEAFDSAFDHAYALGKQETKQKIKQETDAEDTVIQGWVARDKNGLLSLFRLYRPERGYDYNGDFGEWGTSIGYQMTIPNRLFPDLKWSDEPQEVEIIIKRKKK